MKHIDAEKLIKSVNNYREGARAALNPIDGDADYYTGKIDACEDIKEFITSLQQEQPEVELEEAAAAIILKKHPIMKDAFTMEMAFYEMLELVKAGYELGLNARKED